MQKINTDYKLRELAKKFCANSDVSGFTAVVKR